MDLTVIENLSIDRVIKRGTAKIIEKDVDAILLKDTVSKGVMLACDDAEKGMGILTRNIKGTHPLLMISIDSASGNVHVCIPFFGSPNPMHPMHILDTFN